MSAELKGQNLQPGAWQRPDARVPPSNVERVWRNGEKWHLYDGKNGTLMWFCYGFIWFYYGLICLFYVFHFFHMKKCERERKRNADQ